MPGPDEPQLIRLYCLSCGWGRHIDSDEWVTDPDYKATILASHEE
jgi:hypothetical protein